MLRRKRRIGWAGAAMVALTMLGIQAGACRADDAGDAKQTARAFVQAVATGNGAAARAFLAPAAADGAEGKFIDALAAMLAAQTKLDDAVTAKFKSQKPLRADASAQMVAQIDQATVTLAGDTASLVRPGDPTPLKLQKIDSKWKVTQVGTQQQLEQATPMLNALAKAQLETALEVGDGKYQTFAQAQAAIDARMRTAAAPPATAPHASAPK